MTPFLRQFGTFNETTRKWVLNANTQSLMNSLPLIGKFVGAVIVGPIIERVGHRWTMIGTCCVQIVGPISECERAMAGD